MTKSFTELDHDLFLYVRDTNTEQEGMELTTVCIDSRFVSVKEFDADAKAYALATRALEKHEERAKVLDAGADEEGHCTIAGLGRRYVLNGVIYYSILINRTP